MLAAASSSCSQATLRLCSFSRASRITETTSRMTHPSAEWPVTPSQGITPPSHSQPHDPISCHPPSLTSFSTRQIGNSLRLLCASWRDLQWKCFHMFLQNTLSPLHPAPWPISTVVVETLTTSWQALRVQPKPKISTWKLLPLNGNNFCYTVIHPWMIWWNH